MRKFSAALLVIIALVPLGLLCQQLSLPNRPDSLKFAVIGDNSTGDQPEHEVGARMVDLHREIVVVAFAASASFTFGLFFASAIFPVGSFLMQTRMGAMATLAGLLIAFGVARGLGVGRFDRNVAATRYGRILARCARFPERNRTEIDDVNPSSQS
jgi:hypothetical protein